MGEISGKPPCDGRIQLPAKETLDSCAQPCLLVKSDLTILAANTAAVAQFPSPSSIVGQPLDQILTAQPEWDLRKADAAPSAASFQLKNSPAQIQALCIPCSDEHWLLIFSPNETLPACDPALQELRKTQEDFIYSVSHDLRAPLRAIQGFANLLMQELEQKREETSISLLRRMVVAADRMDAYMNDLLILSRIARAEPLLRPISLSEVIDSVRTDLAVMIKSSSATIIFNPDLPAVAGMNTLCQHVFYQLLHNALTYAPKGASPRILISAQTRGDSVVVEIADNGIGIAPEHHQKIFKPFERLHSADVYTGTGLGLPIVQSAMQKMGGSVSVDSELGKGSRFKALFRKAETLPQPV
jgi:signal transduction histidine kinase